MVLYRWSLGIYIGFFIISTCTAEAVEPSPEQYDFVEHMLKGTPPLHAFAQSDAFLKRVLSLCQGPTCFFSNQYVNNTPSFRKLILDLYKKEKQLNEEGYVVFYHGQHRRYTFLHLLTTALVKKVLQYPVPEHFLFLRTLSQLELGNPAFLKEVTLDNIKTCEGRPEYYYELLFVNMFLLGNCHRKGSGACSLEYLYSNGNVHHTTFTYHDIFKVIDLEYLYQKYRYEVDQLNNQFINLNTKGCILQIAIPKHLVKTKTYIAQPHGYHIGLVDTIHSVILKHPYELLKALKKNPKCCKQFRVGAGKKNLDELEFVISLDKNTLHPKSGILINFEDLSKYESPDQLEQFNKNFDAIIEKMAQTHQSHKDNN